MRTSESMTAQEASLAAPSRAPAQAHSQARVVVEELLARADVQIDGTRPWDLQIRDPRAYRALLAGSLSFGEAYMDGWWDCDALDELVARVFRANLGEDRLTVRVLVQAALAALTNRQAASRAFEVARVHYDAGNDLFAEMLDERLVYTCGFWRDATTLEDAQIAKMDLVCRKLDLRPGMRVLDIGSGYGAFLRYAAETYGVDGVGYSVSVEQTEVARARCSGLPVEFVLEDYRSIPRSKHAGRFDRVVSIGMLEAVGYRNYRAFMQVVHRALSPDGLALIHTVGHNVSTRRGDPWCDAYIFPNGMLPSIAQIGASIEKLFVMEDWHNFGPDYDRTLLAWNERFQAAWPKLRARYSPRFKRMWELYLLGFAGGFRARRWQLWQILLSKPGRVQTNLRLR